MPSKDLHLSDQELLLAADGELSNRRAAQAHAHLAACWDCRARMAEIEETITDFARAHRQSLEPQLPPIAGPRALLHARLTELASRPPTGSWRQLFRFISPVPAAAAVSIAVAAVVLIAVGGGFVLNREVMHRRLGSENPVAGFSERGSEPDHTLTPGVTRNANINDVCAMPREEVVADVSPSLRQEVFEEYGIPKLRASDYEVDYLIAPGLGGAEDIHNLWPEPYAASPWNAHVKDALEESLHEMVCSGKLDLATAQHDISTDWIAAYKKYFHSERPLSLRSELSPVDDPVPSR